jgi:hypothetical protein
MLPKVKKHFSKALATNLDYEGEKIQYIKNFSLYRVKGGKKMRENVGTIPVTTDSDFPMLRSWKGGKGDK